MRARKPKNIYKKIDTKISDNHELVVNFFKIICKMQRFAQNFLQILPKKVLANKTLRKL